MPVGAFMNLMGGAIGASSQQHENEKNRKWQEQQNTVAYERQMEMQRQQNEWSAAQVQIERDYNSYANQSSLMRDAGINPAVMYGWNGGSAVGMSTSSNAPEASTGSPATASVTPPSKSPGDHIASALSSAVPQMVATMNAVEDLRSRQLDNRLKAENLDDFLHGTYVSDSLPGVDASGNPTLDVHRRRTESGRQRNARSSEHSIESIVKGMESSDANIGYLRSLIKTQTSIQALNAELATSEGSKRDKIQAEIKELEKRAALLQKEYDTLIFRNLPDALKISSGDDPDQNYRKRGDSTFDRRSFWSND